MVGARWSAVGADLAGRLRLDRARQRFGRRPRRGDDGHAPGLRARPRQGPGHARRARELRRRRLPRHAARGDDAGLHERPRPRALAGRRDGRGGRQVGQHGRLPLHRRLARHGQPVGPARLREGGHRQGGDSARRRGPRPDRPARRRDLRRERALGGPHRADRLRRHRRRARLPRRRQRRTSSPGCRPPTRTSATTPRPCATSSW